MAHRCERYGLDRLKHGSLSTGVLSALAVSVEHRHTPKSLWVVPAAATPLCATFHGGQGPES